MVWSCPDQVPEVFPPRKTEKSSFRPTSLLKLGLWWLPSEYGGVKVVIDMDTPFPIILRFGYLEKRAPKKLFQPFGDNWKWKKKSHTKPARTSNVGRYCFATLITEAYMQENCLWDRSEKIHLDTKNLPWLFPERLCGRNKITIKALERRYFLAMWIWCIGFVFFTDHDCH